MSKQVRGKCSTQPGSTRVTRSSTYPQKSNSTPRGQHSDSLLLDHLSLMRVTEQQVSLARKGTLSEEGIDVMESPSGRECAVSSSSSQAAGRFAPRGGLETVGRLMKLGRLRNVVVVAGAGISTASGIPDFRTPGTGLYSNMAKYNVPYPEAVFNIDFFSNDPRPFFSLAKELYPGRHRPNYIHYFIRMLHHKGLLLRMYTQNIDGLEKMCGIPDDKLVEAHGSFASASCHLCYTPFPADEAKEAIMSDNVPTCSFCSATVKPNVVFFGEDLPEKYFQHVEDFPKADLLMIMGTSLKIEPFASLVNSVKCSVTRLLLNRQAVGPFERKPLKKRDYMQLGDLLESVTALAHILGWHHDIQQLMNSHENTSLPMVIASPPPQAEPQPSQQRSSFLGRRGASQTRGRIPAKSRAGALASSYSSSEEEESDSSETDSKSTESSAPSRKPVQLKKLITLVQKRRVFAESW